MVTQWNDLVFKSAHFVSGELLVEIGLNLCIFLDIFKQLTGKSGSAMLQLQNYYVDVMKVMWFLLHFL